MLGHATAAVDWIVVLPVLLGLGGAALLLVLRSILVAQRWICLIVLLAIFAADWLLLQRVLAGGPLAMTMGNWLPPFGISFAVDAFGAGFALLAAIVALGAWLTMRATPESAVRDGVYPLLLLVIAGVSGAVLTGDLFNLYVWFEVMLIASLGIMALPGNPIQLDGAIKYGVANLIATALLLTGLGLFYGLVGTLNMADVVTRARNVDPPVLWAVTGLLALAFSIKAALFPLGAWLPASYHTPPSEISALVGALLTKVGVYALLRLLLMLLPQTLPTLAPFLTAAAIATMLLGSLGALGETSLRRAIGFLLIGGTGVALACLGEPNAVAVAGAVAYVFHAILTIAALYLVCGVIERRAGSADLRRMVGPAANSTLSLLFLALLLAAAGVPPFLGFWPKLLLLQGLLAAGNWSLVFAILANSLLTLIAGIRLWSQVFWKPPATSSPAVATGTAGPALMTAIVVLAGLFPGLLVDTSQAAARGLLAPTTYVDAVGATP